MSLPAQTAAQYKRQFEELLKRAGTDFTHTPLSGSPGAWRAHFMDPSHTDVAAVNTFGLQVRVARGWATPTIAKMDTITDPSGQAWTVQASHPIWVNNVVIGQKLYVMT